MMKIILVASILLLSVSTTFAQRLQFGFSAGQLNYENAQLKSFDEYVSRLLPFQTAVTDNFPVTPYFGGEAGYHFNSYFIGVNYAFNSTGSRRTATDYSGYYYFDVIKNGHLVSLTPGTYISITNNLKVYLLSDAGVIFSVLKMNEKIHVNDLRTHEEKFDWKTKSFYARPHLRLSYEFFHVKAGLSAGYLLDFQSPFHLKGEKEVILRGDRSKRITSNWNGFMAGLSIYFVI
jgi:hypothetical protein